MHLDGARLWEASAGYDRPPGEIAALFDTAYVSFYKGLGGLAGCAVAGFELSICDATMALELDEIRTAISALAGARA